LKPSSHPCQQGFSFASAWNAARYHRCSASPDSLTSHARSGGCAAMRYSYDRGPGWQLLREDRRLGKGVMSVSVTHSPHRKAPEFHDQNDNPIHGSTSTSDPATLHMQRPEASGNSSRSSRTPGGTVCPSSAVIRST